MKRPESHKTDSSGTIRISNKFGTLGALPIDLRYDKRNILVITEGRRVINHNSSILSFTDSLGVLQGKLATDGKEDYITFTCCSNVKEFHWDISELSSVAGGSCRTGRSKDAKFGHIER